MEHIKESDAKVIPVAPEFQVLEYGALGGGVANGTVAKVNGRYPVKGWGRNIESDELVYVVSGTGALEFPTQSQPLQAGDVAFVPKGQMIAWRGENLKIFIPCVPAWRADQHEFIEE